MRVFVSRSYWSCSASTATSRPGAFGRTRSEEHTSELQSLAYLVCRLLLEKKKMSTMLTPPVRSPVQPPVAPVPQLIPDASTTPCDATGQKLCLEDIRTQHNPTMLARAQLN